MRIKRDWLFLALVVGIMAVTSCSVSDPRMPEVPKETIVAETTKQVTKHVNDLHYLEARKLEAEELIEEPAEEYTEEETYYEEEYVEEYADEYVEEYVEEYSEEEVESYGETYIGTYRITAYEWTGNPCANGNYPTEYYTVACNDLPLGTVVYIDGIGQRVVEDTGGGGSGWMDLYLGDVSACYEWGVQYRDVYIID